MEIELDFKFSAEERELRATVGMEQTTVDDIVADASLERAWYHKLAWRDLEELGDAESIYERGRRIRNGHGVAKDEEGCWSLIIEAARLGHTVALGFCFRYGHGTSHIDLGRATELFRASAERGHPAGSASLRNALFSLFG